MSMSSLLLIGVIGVFLVLIFKKPILNVFGENHKFVDRLRNAKWFQNYWLSGIFLFVLNAVLFFSTVLVLYGLMQLLIPFVHIIVMFLAVIGSIFSWFMINKAWVGVRSNRLKMAAIGSSFYIFLTSLFVYRFVTLKPSYPGEDTFMAAIGLGFAINVTTVAFITCFVITGFSKTKAAK